MITNTLRQDYEQLKQEYLDLKRKYRNQTAVLCKTRRKLRDARGEKRDTVKTKLMNSISRSYELGVPVKPQRLCREFNCHRNYVYRVHKLYRDSAGI